MTSGSLDIAHCAQEPIHAPGGVQPHAAFLALDPRDGAICAASRSLRTLAGAEGGDTPRDLSIFDAESRGALGALLAMDGEPRAVTLGLTNGLRLDGLCYRSDGLLMVDLEPASDPEPVSLDAAMLRTDAALTALREAPDTDGLRARMIEAVAALTGFDRVMLYRFDAEWNGEVVAETRGGDARDSFLGLKFPSSDIPPQARALFLRNRVRQIVDVDAAPSPILPDRHPVHGGPLDLSDSQVRAVSPIHLQYLRNMGVRASLVVALIRGDALRGLLACHHYGGPRAIPARIRTLCGLLCAAFTAELGAHQERARTERRGAIRERLEPLSARAAAVARASGGLGFETFLRSAAPTLMEVIGADALQLTAGDHVATVGDAPFPERLGALACLGQTLAEEDPRTIILVDDLERHGLAPQPRSAGFAYLSASGDHGGVLALRRETVVEETWAGDPEKRVVAAEDGERLHPRGSFSLWRRERRGRASPWAEDEAVAIRMVAERLPRWRLAFEQARRASLIATLEESRAEARRLALIAERANDMMTILDAEGRVVWVNAAFTAHSGYQLAEVEGACANAVFSGPLTDPADLARLDAAIRDRTPARVTLRAYGKRPEPRWIDLTLTPLSETGDDGDARERFIAIARDVDEAWEAAEALRRAESRLTSIIQGADAGTWEWNVQTGRAIFNERWASMAGHTLASLGDTSVETWIGLIHPEDFAAAKKLLDAHFAGETDHYACELRMRRPDGAWTWVHAHGQLISRTPEGDPEWVAGVHIDIDDRKRAEAALARSARLGRMIEESLTEVFVFDAETMRFVEVNRGARENLGYSLDELRAMSPVDIKPDINETQFEAMIAPLRDRREAMLSFRTRHQRRDGSTYPAEIRVQLVEEDRPVFVATVQDATERDAAEAALIAAREEAEAASRAKSAFLANMSHEIRTPMNGVIGMAETLDAKLTDPEHRRMLGVIRDSGRFLLAVINDILDLSKIESGAMTLVNEPFDPCDLIRKVETAYSLKADQKGLSLSVACDSASGRRRLGDAHRLMQILHNLVGNAIKFTESGAVRVKVGDAPGAPLEIAVADSGIGMTLEQAERVFEAFAQADATTTRRFGGTGLGLSIVRSLVDLMGGAIDVETAPGEGATIRLSLPLEEVHAAQAPRAAASGSDPVDAPLPPLRILAADDNEINRMVLSAMLGQLGQTAEFVETGAAALSAFETGVFDLLLLDVSMPVMDGVEAIGRIRAVEHDRSVDPTPAIAVTANAMAHQIESYRAAGFDAHVAKPIELGALAAAIRSAIERVQETV